MLSFVFGIFNLVVLSLVVRRMLTITDAALLMAGWSASAARRNSNGAGGIAL